MTTTREREREPLICTAAYCKTLLLNTDNFFDSLFINSNVYANTRIRIKFKLVRSDLRIFILTADQSYPHFSKTLFSQYLTRSERAVLVLTLEYRKTTIYKEL